MTFPLFCAAIVTALIITTVLVLATAKTFRADRYQAMSWNLDKAVQAHIRRTNCTAEHAARMDKEFRRWFVVAAASPVLLGMDSKAVDEYWHTLLDVDGGTLYREFCEAVAGRQISHIEGVGSADLSARAWVAWEAIWGNLPPEDLFLRPDEAALERYRNQVRTSSSSDGGDSSFVSLDFGSSCSSDGGHGCGGDGGHDGGDGGGSDGGGCGGGGSCGGGGE